MLEPDVALHFNTSHDDDMAVIAVTRGGRVGVDIERLRSMDDVADLAVEHLTPRELEALQSLAQESRSASFLTSWTRKESLAKAIGIGLALPFRVVDLSADDGTGQGTAVARYAGSSFTVAGFAAPAGYVGAIAIEANQVTVRRMDPAQVAR